MPSAIKNPEAHFWSRVEKSCFGGCWDWQGSKRPYGYGRVRFKGVDWIAHRLAWFLTYGDPGELCCLHRCDRPQCVNPAHLFLGTRADNTADMDKKGRRATAAGESHGGVMLTDNQVRLIRILRGQRTQAFIAQLFGVGKANVSHIQTRRIWKHVA